MDPVLLDGIVKLGGMGVLGFILCYVFMRYIPKRDAEVREDRKEDRAMCLKMAEDCHAAQIQMQATFVAALHNTVDQWKKTLEENSEVTRALSRDFKVASDVFKAALDSIHSHKKQ